MMRQFGGPGGGGQGRMQNQEEMLQQAQQFQETLDQVAVINRMYARSRRMCWKKCVHRYTEGELAAGEANCVDRCVLKFLEVHKVMAGRMEQTQQVLAEQAKGSAAFYQSPSDVTSGKL